MIQLRVNTAEFKDRIRVYFLVINNYIFFIKDKNLIKKLLSLNWQNKPEKYKNLFFQTWQRYKL